MYQKAVTSLVLGIMSIFIPFIGLFTGVLGLIYANQATRQMTGDESGQNFALGGKVCSIIGICLQTGIILFFIFVFLLFRTIPNFI